MSLCKGEGNTHSTHKNNTVALINKIRVTTVRQLRAHMEEDEDRTSRGVKAQAWGRGRGSEGQKGVTLYSRAESALVSS